MLDSGQAAVSPETEDIARLVPKRNVETWIMCLNGERVDEDSDYKDARNDWTLLIPPAAATLVGWTPSGQELPNYCVESLRTGIQELRRVRL